MGQLNERPGDFHEFHLLHINWMNLSQLTNEQTIWAQKMQINWHIGSIWLVFVWKFGFKIAEHESVERKENWTHPNYRYLPQISSTIETFSSSRRSRRSDIKCEIGGIYKFIVHKPYLYQDSLND